MKLKSIFTALLFALCCIGATGQTTYPDAIKRFMASTGRLDASKEQMQEGLALITQAFAEEAGEEMPEGCTPEQLASEYMETQFMRDFVTILVPSFAEEMSIEEINTLSDVYETEEGRVAHEHNQEFLNGNMLRAVLVLMGAVEDIKAGKKPKNVKAKVSKQRRKLFMQYCEQSEIQSIIDEIKADEESLFSDDEADSMAVDEDEASGEEIEFPVVTATDLKMVKAYQKYVEKNLVNILLNAADCLTDDDLRFLLKVTAMPEFKKVQKATSGLQDDTESFGMEVIMKYAEWLEGHE